MISFDKHFIQIDSSALNIKICTPGKLLEKIELLRRARKIEEEQAPGKLIEQLSDTSRKVRTKRSKKLGL